MPEQILPPAGHEASDVSFRGLAVAGSLVAAAIGAMLLAVAWLYPDATTDGYGSAPVPAFAAPVLQSSPSADMAAFRAQQTRQLEGAYWIDRPGGVVHLPIGTAMEKLAAEGIADWPGGTAVRALVMLLALLVGGMAPDVSGLGFAPRLGERLPVDAVLRDEAGQPVTLGAVMDGRPLVLALGYYACRTLCGVVREDTVSALERAGLRPGSDYRLLVLSVDPGETPADAAPAKAGVLARYPDPAGAANWRFLTADAAAIGAVTAAAGFSYRWDERLGQFLHPAGLVIATADGTLSSAEAGVGYDPGVLRSDVKRAGQGAVLRALAPVLLLCFHFDAASGRYDLSILRALGVLAGLTVLTLGGTLLALHRARAP